MKFLLFGRVHFHSLLAVALFAPITLAIGQTDAPGSAASGDDLAKRLEWLRAQVGKSADPKAAPNPANKKHFSDSRTLGLRPAEPHPSETDTPKSTPAPALKSIAQGPATTPSPSKTQAPELTPKKSRIADRTASETPSPASPSSKTTSTKVAKASPSPSPAAAQKSVAQAPSTISSPAKTQAPDSTPKKSRIADRSTSATPSPSPQPKTGSAEPRTKIAKVSPSPSPVPAQKSIAQATPIPATPAPRVAAKPTATPARRSEVVSLDTRFTDLRTTSSTHSLTSKPLSPITSITPSVPMTGSSTFSMPKSNSVSSRYPWKTSIVTTVFWIGEPVGGRNYTPNVASSWDPIWTRNYGGYDNPKPEARRNFIPANFIPRQNPFYVALPYNDVTRGTTKPEARVVIPWFRDAYRKEGQSVCRDRWVAVRSRSGRVAYAQWSDCGPFRTDHWQYVFGMERPKPNLNQGAGLDVSPAMRDYLGLQSTDVTDWKFVEAKDVPSGPWALYGDNNTCTQRGRFVRGGQAMPEVAARTR